MNLLLPLLGILCNSIEQHQELALTTNICNETNYRLPRTILPTKYNLTFQPLMVLDENTTKFNGSVTIYFITTIPTKFIVLHAVNLTITQEDFKVTNSQHEEIPTEQIYLDPDRYFMVIQLQNSLVNEETYALNIKQFSGNLTYDHHGVNLGKYKENDNDKILLLSQFESRKAREAFPCLDEPDFRANFVLNLIRPKEYASLSNAPLNNSLDLGDGNYMDTFEETPKMSSYSLAFVITQFDSIQKGNQRFFVRRENIKHAQFALDVAVDAYEEIEKYLNISCGITKVDHVSIPKPYFQPEGMENWGLILYKEAAVLLGMPGADRTSKVTETVTHEMIHQWFGGLITMKWWSLGWLKEGFATYLSFFIGDKIRPEYNMMDVFMYTRILGSFDMETNSYENELGLLTDEGKNPGDGPPPYIPYMKAPSVVHTMKNFLTEELFRESLHYYLDKHQYKTVDSHDLYQAFETTLEKHNKTHYLGGFTIYQIMDSWENELSAPLLTANMDYSTGRINVSQESLFKSDERNLTTIWIIPINIAYSPNATDFSNTRADFWLNEKNITTVESYPTDGWYLMNKQMSTFMRINYDKENWERLAKVLDSVDFGGIHKYNRLQLISDSFYFADEGRLDFDTPVRISWHLRRETSISALGHFLRVVYKIRAFYKADPKNIFKDYMQTILAKALQQYGCTENDQDSDNEKYFKNSLATWLSYLEEPTCSSQIIEFFQNWKNNNSMEISKYYKYEFFCNAMRSGGYNDWAYIYQKFLNETDQYTKRQYARALGCTRNETALNELFDDINSKNLTLNYEELHSIYTSLFTNSGPGKDLFIKHLVRMYQENSEAIPYQRIEVQYLIRVCYTQELYDMLVQTGIAKKSLKAAEENLEFLKKHNKTITIAMTELLKS